MRTHTYWVCFPFLFFLSACTINQQRLTISNHQYESELSAGVLYNCWATSYATAQRILTRQLAPVCPLARAWSDLIGWSVWQALCWLCVCEGPSSNTGCPVSSLWPRTHKHNFYYHTSGSEEHLCLCVKTGPALYTHIKTHTLLSCSSLRARYMQLYGLWCVCYFAVTSLLIN